MSLVEADQRRQKTRCRIQVDSDRLLGNREERLDAIQNDSAAAAAAADEVENHLRHHSRFGSDAFVCGFVWEVEDPVEVSVCGQVLEEKEVRHLPSHEPLRGLASLSRWRRFRSVCLEWRFGN